MDYNGCVNAQNIRVLICGGHLLGRHGLAALLAEAPDLVPILSESDPVEARARSEREAIDLLLWDVTDGDVEPEDLEPLLGGGSQTTLVVLSTDRAPAQVARWLRAGVRGFILGDTPPAELFALLRQASRGDAVLSKELTPRLIEILRAEEAGTSGSACEALTEREMEVLRLVVNGASNKAAAQELYLSVRTIEGHLANIYAKLGVNSRTEAALIAVKEGWVEIG